MATDSNNARYTLQLSGEGDKMYLSQQEFDALLDCAEPLPPDAKTVYHRSVEENPSDTSITLETLHGDDESFTYRSAVITHEDLEVRMHYALTNLVRQALEEASI